MRKFKMFLSENWGKLTIAFLIVILLFLAVIGLMNMESFYRNMQLAQMPMYILLGGIQAIVFVGAYMYFLMDNRFTKSNNKKVKASNINVKFSDVIGLEGAKKEAMEVVQLIKDSARLQKIGGKILKGIILMGPPGCGKTLLAKAIATEAKMPFISMAGSEFVEMYVGVGASRVRNLFKKARKLAYAEGACVLFIDEIDVIGRGRSFMADGGGRETNSTQNQLLVEMDGLESKKHNVIVIAATNADESVLDKALLRPGRFDRKITMTLPNLKEREDIFRYYMGKIKTDESIDIPRLARKSIGKSPAEIENIVKESALIATRNKKDSVSVSDVSEAMDRIDLGLESHLIMTDREKEMTAYHEAGHAATLYFLHPTDDVFKITIKSRGGALGLVAHNPKEEHHSHDKEKLIADIIVALAGYCAEKIKYNTSTTGVSSDFKKAMNIANTMVWKLGMGKDGFIGDFSSIPKECMSSKLKEELNRQTIEILVACQIKVCDCLKSHWAIIDELASTLIEKEELGYDEVEEIFSKHISKEEQEAEKNNLKKSFSTLILDADKQKFFGSYPEN